MKTPSRRMYWLTGSILLAVLLVLAACTTLIPREEATPTEDPLVPSELCPEATPEYFQVEPVTSPTNDLKQTIVAELGNAEIITVTTESGTFTAVGAYPTEIEIDLLPGTTHNLTVSGRVMEVQQGDCTYGGYELSTTRDRNGAELVIVQEP